MAVLFQRMSCAECVCKWIYYNFPVPLFTSRSIQPVLPRSPSAARPRARQSVVVVVVVVVVTLVLHRHVNFPRGKGSTWSFPTFRVHEGRRQDGGVHGNEWKALRKPPARVILIIVFRDRVRFLKALSGRLNWFLRNVNVSGKKKKVLINNFHLISIKSYFWRSNVNLSNRITMENEESSQRHEDKSNVIIRWRHSRIGPL